MSMKSTPSSTARRSTRRASSGSAGSPQIPGPVIRMAPYPMRVTSRSSPRVKVPLAAAGEADMGGPQVGRGGSTGFERATTLDEVRPTTVSVSAPVPVDRGTGPVTTYRAPAPRRTRR